MSDGMKANALNAVGSGTFLDFRLKWSFIYSNTCLKTLTWKALKDWKVIQNWL